MRTSKPIATISYNSEEHLRMKLAELVKSHKISDWMYVFHDAEADERKDHFHLWLKPNTLLDTMDLQKHFEEIDLKNPTKPLKCIDFKISKIDDWILYSEHYAPYLASKGESREFVYSKTDFRYLDEDTFEDNYQHAHKGSEWAHRNQILEALRNNAVNPQDLILNGTLPLNMASQVNALEYMKTHYGKLDRGKHDNHENSDI